MRKTILIAVIFMLVVPALFAQELFVNSVAGMNGWDWIELNQEQKTILATGIMYGMYWANIALLGYDADHIGMMSTDQFRLIIETLNEFYAIESNREILIFMAISTAFILSWNF